MVSGVSVDTWVDEDGRVISASSPLGFTMQRTEYELARQAQEESALNTDLAIDEDVILSTAIASNVDFVDVTEHDVLRFRLTGVDLDGFQLDGGRQELRGDTLIIHRENWDALDPGYSLPYKTMDMRDVLESEPLVQSDDSSKDGAAFHGLDGHLPYPALVGAFLPKIHAIDAAVVEPERQVDFKRWSDEIVSGATGSGTLATFRATTTPST